MSKNRFKQVTQQRGAWPLVKRPGFLVRRLHQIHVALFTDICGKFGLTPVQYSLLSALARRGQADQSTLAADIALDKTTTAGVIKRLEARGLLQRTISQQDRRARVCILKARSKTLLRRMEPQARKAHLDTIAGLNSREQALLTNLLSRAIAAHATKVGPPPL